METSKKITPLNEKVNSLFVNSGTNTDICNTPQKKVRFV